MATLSSAESATKLLRSKTETLNNIILTANALLDESLNVFLPNKELFIFELLCDRISDFNTVAFKPWKFQKQVWALFNKIWDMLSENSDDIKLRNKIARRIRLIDILIVILRSDIDEDILDCVVLSIEKVSDEIYVEIEDSSAINLLSSFVSKSISSTNYDNWIDLISKLFELSQSNIGKFNKKNTNKYFQECLPVNIAFIVKNGEFSKTSKKLLEMTSKLIFDKDFSNSITSNFEILIKKESDSISIKSMEFLFQYFVDHLSKNIKLCEEIFILITNAPKFNELSESLLEILSSKNRPLSSNFFKSIFEKEVTNKAESDINWKLVMHLIDLDVNLAIDNSQKLLSIIPVNLIGIDLSLNIGLNIINSYITAREFPDFFNKIWFSASKENIFWQSNEFIDLVSSKIDTLSSSQLKSILTNLFTRSDSLPQLTSVLEGLTNCKDEKISNVKDLILSNYKRFSDVAGYWKMAYYVLCLYGEDIIQTDEEWQESFKSLEQSKFFFDCIFRTIELTGSSTIKLNYQDEYFQFLKNNKTEICFSLRRWLIIINSFFNTSQISSFINIIFESLGLDELSEYLSTDSEIFFEQKNIFSSLINYILNKIENGEGSYVKIITLIPIQCFDKSPRKKLLDIILSFNTSGVFEIKEALLHLLEQPSFRSKLELDFYSLIAIFDTSVLLSDKLSVKIANKVWKNHLQQYNANESKTYVLDTITYLSKFLNDYPHDSKIHGELELTLSVLLIGKRYNFLDDEFTKIFDNLLCRFIELIEKLLHHYLETDDDDNHYNIMVWLLNSCYMVLERDSPVALETLRIVRKIGPKVSSLKNEDSANKLRVEMFKLLCKLSGLNIKSATFIVSLFISLKEKFDLQIEEALDQYVNDFTLNEEFISLFKYVLFSIEEVKNKQINIFIPILLSFIRALQKGSSSESVRLFVSSLSTILSSQEYLSYESKILLLTTLKSCLSEKIWLFNQYAIETVITIVTKLTEELKLNDNDNVVNVYVQLTQVTSHIILFHRFRLNSRHHIVITACTSLLEALCYQNSNSTISQSSECAFSYTRLIGNLCEPSNMKLKEDTQSLNTTSSLIKRSLRKHIPILLLNYIHCNLKFNFDSKINKELIEGIYMIFDVLSELELQLINASLDVPGRSYFKTLYSNYKDHGKWIEQ